MKRTIKVGSKLVIELSLNLSKELGYTSTHPLVQKAVESTINTLGCVEIINKPTK